MHAYTPHTCWVWPAHGFLITTSLPPSDTINTSDVLINSGLSWCVFVLPLVRVCINQFALPFSDSVSPIPKCKKMSLHCWRVLFRECSFPLPLQLLLLFGLKTVRGEKKSFQKKFGTLCMFGSLGATGKKNYGLVERRMIQGHTSCSIAVMLFLLYAKGTYLVQRSNLSFSLSLSFCLSPNDHTMHASVLQDHPV